MGLLDSQVLNSLHPWLRVRLEWMAEVALAVGSIQRLFSGFRTLEQQRYLYDTVSTGRPVAFPGCSQHNYGFAADGSWDPILQITHKGRLRSFTIAETISFMNQVARHVNLTLVAGDNGHFQIYPGLQFKQWAVSMGFCDPHPPLPAWKTPVQSFLELNCPPGTGGAVCSNLGCFCQPTLDVLRGIEASFN